MKFLFVLTLLLAACHRGPGLPPVTPPAHRTLGNACSPGEPVSCPRALFLQGLEEAALAYQMSEVCRVDLVECQKISSIDQAVYAGQLQECQVRADQRWLWAVGGTLIGAVAAGLVVGLGH